MVTTLAKHNEAFELTARLNHDDAKLFSQALRGEKRGRDAFTVRAYTDDCEDLNYAGYLAEGLVFLEQNFDSIGGAA